MPGFCVLIDFKIQTEKVSYTGIVVFRIKGCFHPIIRKDTSKWPNYSTAKLTAWVATLILILQVAQDFHCDFVSGSHESSLLFPRYRALPFNMKPFLIIILSLVALEVSSQQNWVIRPSVGLGATDYLLFELEFGVFWNSVSYSLKQIWRLA